MHMPVNCAIVFFAIFFIFVIGLYKLRNSFLKNKMMMIDDDDNTTTVAVENHQQEIVFPG